jgi:hypothetical protein
MEKSQTDQLILMKLLPMALPFKRLFSAELDLKQLTVSSL